MKNTEQICIALDRFSFHMTPKKHLLFWLRSVALTYFGSTVKSYAFFISVMRLTKPSLMMSQVVTCDDVDIPQDTLNNALARDIATVKGAPQFGLSELLTLPQNFG